MVKNVFLVHPNRLCFVLETQKIISFLLSMFSLIRYLPFIVWLQFKDSEFVKMSLYSRKFTVKKYFLWDSIILSVVKVER